MTFTIQLNGEPRAVAPGTSVPELLARCGLPPESVLVEHNGTALFRSEWGAVELGEGDRVEVIRVVAGG